MPMWDLRNLMEGARAMAQWVKPLPHTAVQVPGASLLTPLPAYGLQRQWIWLRTLGPYAPCGNLQEALGWWCLDQPKSDHSSYWGVNQPLKFSLSLFHIT